MRNVGEKSKGDGRRNGKERKGKKEKERKGKSMRERKE